MESVRLRVCRCFAGEQYAGLLSVNLDWSRLQELLASIESRLTGTATKDSLNAVRARNPRLHHLVHSSLHAEHDADGIADHGTE